MVLGVGVGVGLGLGVGVGVGVGVEAKSQGTQVPYSECTLVLGKSKLTDKKVSWQDTLFPHQDSYTHVHSFTHQRPDLQRVQPMVE